MIMMLILLNYNMQTITIQFFLFYMVATKELNFYKILMNY